MDVADPGGRNEQGSAAGGACGFGVLPFIADDEGAIEIELPFESGFDEQAGFGLAAGAAVGFVVGAGEEIVEREQPAQLIVHAVHFAAVLIAARDAGLIGGGDEDKAGGFKFAQQRSDFFFDVELLQGQWTDLMLAFDPDLVQNTVPFYKYA